jgi:ferric-dicitrate binding protein FerR (iron transport regulator)
MDSIDKRREEQRAVQALLEPMRSLRPVVCDAADAQRRRERLLQGMRLQVASLPEKRRREAQRNLYGGLVGGGLALAAGVALWMSFGKPVSAVLATAASRATVGTLGAVTGDVQRTFQGEKRRAFVGAELAPTEAIHTGVQSQAKLQTPRGVGLDLGAESDLEFLGKTLQGEQVRLLKGAVLAKVPKLGKAASFSVVTPDVVVTVHGTEFTVEVEDKQSCVRVTEGLVAVHPGTGAVAWLHPGDSWGCRSKPPAAKVTPEAAATATVAATPRKSLVRGASSTLTAENRLFEEALLAQREGRDAQAQQLFERFLVQYPKAALAGRAHEQLSHLKSK